MWLLGIQLTGQNWSVVPTKDSTCSGADEEPADAPLHQCCSTGIDNDLSWMFPLPTMASFTGSAVSACRKTRQDTEASSLSAKAMVEQPGCS